MVSMNGIVLLFTVNHTLAEISIPVSREICSLHMI